MTNVLKGTLAAAIAFAIAAIAIVLMVYVTVGNHIFLYVKAVLEVVAGRVALPSEVAEVCAMFVCLLVTAPVVSLLAKVALGRVEWESLTVVALASMCLIMLWALVTRDWLFGVRGEALAFVCPPATVGSGVRVQRDPVDHLLGGQCEQVSSTTAAQVIAQRSAGPVVPVSVSSKEEVLELQRFDVEGPVLLAGDPVATGEAPRLFRGRFGRDPWTGKWLTPATDDDLRQVMAAMTKKEQLAEANLAKLKADALAEGVRKANTAKRKQTSAVGGWGDTQVSDDEEDSEAACVCAAPDQSRSITVIDLRIRS